MGKLCPTIDFATAFILVIYFFLICQLPIEKITIKFHTYEKPLVMIIEPTLSLYLFQESATLLPKRTNLVH